MAQKKYLFFYLNTGNGHLAPAKAVSEKILSKRKADVEIILSDGLKGSRPFIKRIIEKGYHNAVNKAVWIFEFLYALHKIKSISRITAFLVSYFVEQSVEKQILRYKPEKIVVFHFFLIKPVFKIVKKHSLDIPVITVVTDPFTAHPIWFLQKDQRYIVFSDLLKEKCVSRGIAPDNIKVFPFVLDQKYSRRITAAKSASIRRQLGFRRDSRIILILGGGDGMPRGKKILKKLIKSNMDAEIACVCGNNKVLYSHINGLKVKYQAHNLKVFGFIDFVHSLISISDVVITKCGASTFMEILLLGKIPLINNYIWEQEKGNMEYVVGREMGILEKSTSRIPDVLSRLFTDNDYYSSLRDNIERASISNGVNQVSDYILNFNHHGL